MKLKKSLFSFFFILVLSACNFSLSEEITPPPGAEITAAPQSTATPTSNIVTPTNTTTITTNTPEGSATLEDQQISATQAEGETTPSSTGLVTISGLVTSGSGEPLPAGLTATLYGIENQQDMLVLEQPVDSEGKYAFETDGLTDGMGFIVLVKYGEVSFLSQGGTYDGSTTSIDQPITIYESTTELSTLSLDQLHITATFDTAGQLNFNEIYVLTNPGTKSITVETDGTSLPFASTPEGALQPSISLASGSADLLMADSGFAMLPGDQQYAFVVSFTMPYAKSLDISQPFLVPPKSITVIVPAGLKIEGTDLVDQGSQDFQGSSFEIFNGGPLADGVPLDFTISGSVASTPDGSSTTGTSQHLIIGVAALGVVFVVLGVFLFLRDRKRAMLDETEEDTETGEDNEDEANRLADEINQLDDDFKSGNITRKEYTGKRKELTNKLKDLL